MRCRSDILRSTPTCVQANDEAQDSELWRGSEVINHREAENTQFTGDDRTYPHVTISLGFCSQPELAIQCANSKHEGLVDGGQVEPELGGLIPLARVLLPVTWGHVVCVADHTQGGRGRQSAMITAERTVMSDANTYL